MKFPKQWLYWAKKAGLRPEQKRGSYNKYYLIGRNRHWRICSYGYFTCSTPLEYFDRWANSHGASTIDFPTTEKEFIKTVNFLLEHSKDSI